MKKPSRALALGIIANLRVGEEGSAPDPPGGAGALHEYVIRDKPNAVMSGCERRCAALTALRRVSASVAV